MDKKTILITWWTGYIWSHAVVAFEQAWYKTVIVDNLYNSDITTLDWIEKIIWYKLDFYEVDLRDKDKLEKVFEKYNFDWVIHFAWLKAVWESCEKPLNYFDNNIVWSIKLFECMEKFWVKNLIFSSSATVYDSKIFDSKNFSWASEDDLVWNTINPYWTTKFLIEYILKDLSKFSSFNVMNLRYFNPIWAHPSWFIWEEPDWIPNNLLPFIMKVATGELEKLKVFWSDYNTIDWTWVRDYIDVVDLIEGHLKAYEKIEKWFNVYNLWVWEWVSVLEMIKKSEKITWNKINYEIVSRRDWDLAEVYCNPSKAKKELDWEVKTSLEDSLRNSWKFYNK
jgi:UDP-glucose 4-epimerase